MLQKTTPTMVLLFAWLSVRLSSLLCLDKPSTGKTSPNAVFASLFHLLFPLKQQSLPYDSLRHLGKKESMPLMMTASQTFKSAIPSMSEFYQLKKKGQWNTIQQSYLPLLLAKI